MIYEIITVLITFSVQSRISDLFLPYNRLTIAKCTIFRRLQTLLEASVTAYDIYWHFILTM
jgi:hypothetical protein